MNIVIALLRQIVLAVLGNSDLTRRILDAMGVPAQAEQLDVVQGLVQEDHDLLRDPTVGLDAIQTLLATVLTDLTAGITVIEADLSNIISGAYPVTPITPPPAGYGGGGGGITAGDVWAEILPGTGQAAGTDLAELHLEAAITRNAYLNPFFRSPDFWLVTLGAFPNSTLPTEVPFVQWDHLLPTDTINSFLTREYPTQTWVDYTPDPDYQSTIIIEAGVDYLWVFRFNPAEFRVLQASTVGTSSLVPPIWPGSALVTFGTPVALTSALDVDTPMDGVLITLDTVPPGKPTYTLGSAVGTAHIGQVAFKSDGDSMEYPQNLSFASEIYCPTSMVQAAGVKIRCVPGVTGTVTPWTIT